MRFGREFHRLAIPEFETFYIDYNRRKASIKELHIQGQDLDSTYRALRNDLGQIEALQTRVLASVLNQEKVVIDNFCLEGSPTTIHTRCFGQQELAFLAEEYRSLLDEVLGLRWFDRVNKEAGRRLFGKLKRIDLPNAVKHETQRVEWLEAYDTLEVTAIATLRRMHSLRTKLEDALVERIQDPDTGPLKETPWRFSSTSDQLSNTEFLHHLVLQGDADKLIQLAHPDSTFDFGTVQLEQVIKYLILHELDAAAIQVLERSPDYAQCITKDCLLFCMRVATCVRPSNKRSTTNEPRGREEGLLKLFQRMLQFYPGSTLLLVESDGSGLELLSYAAKHDLRGYCEAILSLGGPAMRRDWIAEFMRVSKGPALLLPFETMLHRHQSTFIDIIKCLGEDTHGKMEHDLQGILDGFLAVAVRTQNDGAVQCLIDSGAGIPSKSTRGQANEETALHFAALQGRSDYVNLLLANFQGQSEIVDATEPRRGRTALAIACIYGHEGVVEALLHAGADSSVADHFGWTAKEHAAYRGHQLVAGLFGDWDSSILQGGPASNIPAVAEPVAPTLKQGEQAIIFNLGSVQARLKEEPVVASCCSPIPAAAAKEDSSYTLTVSAPQDSQVGETATSITFDLPLINDDVNTNGCVFVLKEDARPVLTFRVTAHNHVERSQERVIGIGSAVLEGIKLAAGCPRENLVRDMTAAILDCVTMDVIGTVLFTFVRATPYPYLQKPLSSQKRQNSDGVKLVGHRGLGQNLGKDKYLQIGENTIQRSGLVPLLSNLVSSRPQRGWETRLILDTDLQLTRDLEAVLYHDLSFSESGTDIPIHDLTLEQFRYASSVQSPHGNPASVIGSPHNPTSRAGPRARSRSVSVRDEPGATQVQDRVKHTVDFQAKGFKPNTRGEFIHDSLVTLEEIFRELPEDVGFNIEFKHPRIHETIAAGVAPVVIEINKFIDVALDKIRQSSGNRPLVLSSFTPEVCILLALKQRAYPVLYITNAGKPPPNDLDKRAASVQTAVHFARRWGLAGVVFASEPFLLCPRLVRLTKNAGLLCGTYGSQNNEPDNAEVWRFTYSTVLRSPKQ
ncbi:ankyrin repeat-containing protein [Apiospora rasikravindrae]|uniref:Ankyrin repeat-containing protein n=1 Tax=Apiospora rasikravindrae TaxID=990691 RepID=A0ABR1TZ38_9PEZI